MRKFLTKRPSPYYILAPDYRRSSSGIRVLHMLCDMLIRSGHEAYVTATVLSPEFMTPRLTDDVIAAHRSQGIEPIVVYPEIVDGNPLEGRVVVRYILNRPGFIQGSGHFNEGDILYAYSRDLLQEGMPEDRVMLLPPFDLNVFRLPDEPNKRVSGKACYYKGRNAELSIDPSLLPLDAVEITPHWPESWEGLADLFQQCEIFYCCGSSALATEAALCGCLTVVVVAENAPRIGVHETQSPGAAWGVAPDEIARARETLHLARDVWIKLQNDFWPALDHFIEVTQAAATQYLARSGQSNISTWLNARSLTPIQNSIINKYKENAVGSASLGIIILDLEGDHLALAKTLQSLNENNQLDATIQPILLSTVDVDVSLISGQVIKINSNDLAQELNLLTEESKHDWLMLVSAGEQFTASGLTTTTLELLKSPACHAIYTDIVFRQTNGELGVSLRPDFNLDYFLSFPAGTAKHWLFNRQALLDLGGFNPQLPDALELDAILRLINHGGIEGLGHIAEPLVITHSPALANIDDERKAIEAHLQQRGYFDAQVHAPKPGRYQIRYNHPQQPIVSIVLIAEASLAHMQRCVDGLLSDTTYQNFEVLLFATQNTSSEVSAWLAELASLQEAKLRIFNFPEGDRAEQCNQAALQAIGDYVLFLSADTSVVSAHWLDELLNHAQRGEVGVVGAKLLSPTGKIAHAGHILGLEGPLGSPFVGEHLDAPGYMQRLQVDQNLSAVGLDCFMVLRELFVELDGFAENQLAIEYLSADFCLRAREAGFLTVWTPHAQLMLDQDAQARPSSEQQDAMYEKWLPQLAHDPAYNPNFSLSVPGGFKLADTQISWRPLDSFRPAPIALVHPADLFGCGHYRVMQPFLAMKEAELLDGAISTGLMHVTDLERYNPDTIILQRQIGDERLEAMRRMQRFSKAFKVYELDDYLPNLPLKSVHRVNMPKDILRSLRKGLSYVDRFVVSTESLAEAFSGLHDEIVVMENRLPVSWWQGLQTQRRQGKKPRVGWAGGSSHTGDLELIADVVRDLADEVEWVFLGMCPDKLRPYVHEYHDGVAIEQYPAKLASLNLDLGLAPLEMNLFNECKSNLRLLEYGACGIPVVCTDIRCYQNDFPVTRVRNRYKDWIEAIRMHINDLDRAAKLGDDLQAKVRQEWMLEGTNLELWRKAWLPS